MTFPHTKIQPPRTRATFVERGVVQARLADALLDKRLVLLCAPAGYGKTSLLAHQLAQLPAGSAVAWVSADPADDLGQLLECMLAALEPYDPPWRVAPEALVVRAAADDELRTVVSEVINTIDACGVEHGVIAFDDLHRVDDARFFRFLELLIERLSARWCVAITSRLELPLPLARLRGRGEIAEFRQLQLQFARNEARQLAHGAGLDDTQADRLFDRTQGWPAGLRIAIGAVQANAPASGGRALRASEQPLFEFLVTEVLQQLPAALADFLLASSVLPELEATRCAAVTGDPQASVRLDEIERLGLFVDVLDGAERTLKLHDLFRDALLAQLARSDPQRLAALRRRAAETEPDPVRRMGWLLQAGELAAAEQLAFERLPALIVTAGPAAALHLVGQFPADSRERSPELAYVRALAHWAQSWDFPTMYALMDQAARAFAERGDAAREGSALAHASTALIALGRIAEAGGLLARLRANALSPEIEAIVLNAEAWHAIDVCRYRDVAPLRSRLLDLLQQAGRIELWYQTTPPLRMPGLPGMTPVLERHAALMLAVAGEAPTPLRAIALQTQAWCALWRGRIDEARRFVASARDEAQWIGQTRAVRAHLLTFGAALGVVAGDAAGARAAIEERLRTFSPTGSAWTRYILIVSGGRIAASAHDQQALRDALRQAELVCPKDATEALRRPRELPLEAQLAWLEGRRDEAITGWQRSLAIEDQIDVMGLAAEVRVRLARALADRGDLRGAANTLMPVFERARIDGPGGALLAGDALRALSASAWQRALTAEQQAELRAWWAIVAAARGQPGSAGQPGPATTGSGAEALSARELEVLARIAAGDSNKLIARAFDLSLHTVKRHVANILSKLNVETRGQAAAWYRAERTS